MKEEKKLENINLSEETYKMPPYGFLYADVDENYKLIIMNQIEAQKLKLPLVEFEQAYNGALYKKGYAPEKSIELQQEEVRELRNRYLEEYIDPIVTNPLRWEDLSDKEKQKIKDYRRYLLDYTEQDKWWEKEPLTFDEWKVK